MSEMFKNLPGNFDNAVANMSDNGITLDMDEYSATLPTGINLETVNQVASHYRAYNVQTAENFVRNISTMDAGDYTMYADTPFGPIEHAITTSEEGCELTMSAHIDMTEYRETLETLHASVGNMDLGSDLEEEAESDTLAA